MFKLIIDGFTVTKDLMSHQLKEIKELYHALKDDGLIDFSEFLFVEESMNEKNK